MNEHMTVDQSIRLLRAKAHELENVVLNAKNPAATDPWYDSIEAAADIALIADLLAAFMEASSE